jgi:hypothetical protein
VGGGLSAASLRVNVHAGLPRPGAIATSPRALARHFVIRLGGVLRDPAAIAFLAFAGLSTLFLWSQFGVARPHTVVIGNPLPESIQGDLHFPGPAEKAVGSARFSLPSGGALVVDVLGPGEWRAFPGWTPPWRGILAWNLVCQFLWAPVVVLFVSGNTLVRRSLGSATGPPLPALPIGPRSRAVAEALVALAFVVAARTPLLRVHPPELLFNFSYLLMRTPGPVPTALAWTASTILGALFAWPLLLAWVAVPRLDRRGWLAPGLVMAALSLGVGAGVSARPLPAAFLALALSVLVLALVGTEIQVVRPAAERPSGARLFRPSPGPLAQFRRDQWRGPLRALWPFLVLVVPGPLVLAILRSRRFDVLALQLLLLTATLFYPLGLKLVSAAAPGSGAVWNGYYLSAWPVLPVRRETVLRAVYAHGWAAGGLVWLLFCLYRWLYGGGPWPSLFELPAVVLAAGVLVCAAAGDRWRGTLALVSLVTFQMGVPLLLTVAETVFLVHVKHERDVLIAAAYVLGLVGGLPPLVHLRSRGVRPRAA